MKLACRALGWALAAPLACAADSPLTFDAALALAEQSSPSLAALDALNSGAPDLRRRDSQAFLDARTELERFVALWPSATAPEHPPAYRDVLAQGSRVRLALSPYL